MTKEFLGMKHHVHPRGSGSLANKCYVQKKKKKKTKNSDRDSNSAQSYIYKALSDCPFWTQMCQKWLDASYCWATPSLRSARPELPSHCCCSPAQALGRAIQCESPLESGSLVGPVSFRNWLPLFMFLIYKMETVILLTPVVDAKTKRALLSMLPI